MDSSSWIHGFTGSNNGGFMCGYAASSCSLGEFHESEQQQQQLLFSSQIQHHLNQISMHMSMDDEAPAPAEYGGGGPPSNGGNVVDDLFVAASSAHHAGSFPSSSSSSSFRSASASYSLESSAAAHVLAAPAAAAATGFQYPEVSSQAPSGLASMVPYDAQHGHYTGLPPAELPDTAGGAFRRYARHLGPRRPPKPGAGGQRMFKTAMSVLAKMNMAMKYSRQYYYQQAAAAAAEAAPPAGNQLQHMISERKRREKLNDSFVALKAVLPPGSKKDKTSILIRAREYVKSLESKLSELEEKNRALEAQLASRAGAVAKDEDEAAAPEVAGEKADDLVEIEVTSDNAAGDETAAAGEELDTDVETCTLNVALTTPPSRRGGGGGGISTTDVVLRTLQCLREQIGDGASLVAMSTSAGSGGRPPRANLTLQLKV